MVTRIGGQRRKTRAQMTKPKRARGKMSLRMYLQQLEPGQRVVLKAEPSVQEGVYFRRFHGKVALVEEKVGRCYRVVLNDGGQTKRLIVHPVHLKALM